MGDNRREPPFFLPRADKSDPSSVEEDDPCTAKKNVSRHTCSRFPFSSLCRQSDPIPRFNLGSSQQRERKGRKEEERRRSAEVSGRGPRAVFHAKSPRHPFLLKEGVFGKSGCCLSLLGKASL